MLGIVYRCIAAHLIKKAGFSLHAGVAARADQRQKLERLCRYDAQGSASERGRQKAESDHQPAGHLGKTPVAHTEREYSLPAEDAVPRRHDARHLTLGVLPSALRASLRLFNVAPGDVVEPLDFITRLAVLVPKPRVSLTRFQSVFAPSSKSSEPAAGAAAECPLRIV